MFKKIKNFFLLTFDFKNKEKGEVATLAAIGVTIGLIAAVGPTLWQLTGNAIANDIDKGANGFLGAILSGLKEFFLSAGSWLFNYAASFLSYVLSPGGITSGTITQNATFLLVWGDVRDIANMLIVLGFVVVGIATALRISEYAAKNLLFRLILLAILINFSGLFCGLIIDGANITMTSLLKQGGGDTAFTAIQTAVNAYANSQYSATGSNDATNKAAGDASIKRLQQQIANLPPQNQNMSSDTYANYTNKIAAIKSGNYMGVPGAVLQTPTVKTNAVLAKELGIAIALFIFYVIAAYTFALLALLLAARFSILAVLYILSPLAFCFWVFPATKNLWTKWWDNFLKWAFVGVGTAFFIYLAVATLLASATASGGTLDVNVLFVVFIFLIVGYKITNSVAPMVSNAVMGLAKGAAGVALGVAGGAALVGAKLADKATGGVASKAGRSLSNGVGRAMETMGLRKKGTTAMNAQSSLKEARGRIDNMQDSQIAKIAKGKGLGVTSEERTAAVQHMAEKGKLSQLGDTNQQNQAISFAESHAKSRGMAQNDVRGNAEAHNYKLAGLNQDKLKKITQANPGMGSSDVQARAEQEQLRTNLQKGMSTGEAGRIDSTDVSGQGGFDNIVKDSMTPQAVSQMSVSSNRSLIAGMRAHVSSGRFDHAIVSAAGNQAEVSRLTKLRDAVTRYMP